VVAIRINNIVHESKFILLALSWASTSHHPFSVSLMVDQTNSRCDFNIRNLIITSVILLIEKAYWKYFELLLLPDAELVMVHLPHAFIPYR
jgi:hypothetical protein